MERTIVCGLGHVGYRIVALLRRLGEPVTVISLETRSEWERWAEAEGIQVIRGDARDPSLLEEAGIDRARAVIAATDQDAANVEVSLDVRSRRPDIPVVLRLFDQTLAQHLEESFGVRAFGMSAVAAPSFAAAAIGEQILGSFNVGEQQCVIRRGEITEGSPLAGITVADVGTRYRVAPIAHEPSSGDGVVAPSPEQQLRPGDHLIVAGFSGESDAFDPIGTSLSTRRARASSQQRRSGPRAPFGFLRWIWAMWLGGPRPLRVAFVALNLLIMLSVLVFYFGMRLSAVDAFYFVVSTVTTTGYGDITPRDAPDVLKLYAALVMILGSLTLATMYSLITDFVVTSRFRELLGSREVPAGGHTVVVGLGNVGYRVANQLELENQVAVVERDPSSEFVEVTRPQTPLVLGDGRMTETLRRAGVPTAHALLAVTGDDATNLTIGLAARRLNPEIRLAVRIFDADFASKVREHMGFQAVLSGSAIAAPIFVAAALWMDAVAAIEFQRWLLIVRRFVVGAESVGQMGSTPQPEMAVLMDRRPEDRDFTFGAGRTPAVGDEVVALAWRPLVC